MEDDEPYWLESEHVALKGNAEYHSLLATIALLEAQRQVAVKDFDTLLQAKEDALANPINFVHKLQTGQDLGLPKRQSIPELPRIDWERYVHDSAGSNPGRRHGTRQQKQTGSEPTSAKSSRSNTPTSFTSAFSVDDSADAALSASALIRGKKKDTSRSVTFNKLWTLEEQTRLEELLVKFPPEEVEARRWEKIARELGNRTRQQVQSRVQKYFIRLAREGMPVPGRIPNNLHQSYRRRHGNQRNPLFHMQSTFCASYKPPVYMSDDDDSSTSVYAPDADATQLPSTSQQNAQISDEEDIPEELRDTEEYAEILRLKRMKKNKEILQRHLGYQCDRCGAEPIVGSRYHCQDCPPDVSTDFCQRCSDIAYESEQHKAWHSLVEVSLDSSDSHLDQDYQHSQFASGDYNYLDPNYMPAT